MSIYSDRAADTLKYYAKNHGVGSESGVDEETVTELLTDLVHLVGEELFYELTQEVFASYTFINPQDE